MGGADWRDGGAGRYCAVGLARRRFRTGEGWEGRRGGVSAGEVALSGGAGAISYGQANSEVPATPRVIPYLKFDVPRW